MEEIMAYTRNRNYGSRSRKRTSARRKSKPQNIVIKVG